MQIFMAFDVASAGSHALTLRKSSTPSNDDRKFFVKSVLSVCPFAPWDCIGNENHQGIP